MASIEYLSDRNLYFDNRDGDHSLERITDDPTGKPAAKFVNAGKPIPRAVFDLFKMVAPAENKDASTDQVEDKSVTTQPTDDQRRRRVIGSANAEEVQAAQAAAAVTPVASITCGAPTTLGGNCGIHLGDDGLCRYDSHNRATGRTAAG